MRISITGHTVGFLVVLASLAAWQAIGADLFLDVRPPARLPPVERPSAIVPEPLAKPPSISEPRPSDRARVADKPVSLTPAAGTGSVTGRMPMPVVQQKEPPTAGGLRDYAMPLVLVVLATVGVFSIMASVPRLVRAIDRLFEPTAADQKVGAAQNDPFAFAASSPEMSVEDVRREIETLRAMKEQLDAQAEAARAAVRQARAQHQQKEDAA